VTGEIPERDPLADLVSRSIGTRIESVEVEVLPAPDGVERQRLRFTTATGASSAIFERLPRGETTLAQLLPFLARKSDRVPALTSITRFGTASVSGVYVGSTITSAVICPGSFPSLGIASAPDSLGKP